MEKIEYLTPANKVVKIAASQFFCASGENPEPGGSGEGLDE